jgi:iron complex outermembrane receptor protein
MGWRSPFGVRGITVVLDDIPLTVADGQTIMNLVDPAMVQSLELLRGPSATFWGNSSGGVLYMSTRPPSDSPAFSYRTYAGSYQTMKHEVRWHDIINGVRVNAYGSYSQSDGFRDHSASQYFRGGL